MVNPDTERSIRLRICEIGALLYEKGLVAAFDGNVSAKLPDGSILATPSGVCKGKMTPDMIVKTDASGEILEAGKYELTSEFPLHMRAYRLRPDIGAVVHAHPPAATAFACAGKALDAPVAVEAVLSLGGAAPLARYAEPGTEGVPDSISDLICGCDALLLEFHGAVTVGRDLYSAYYRMETLEQVAKVTFMTNILAPGRSMPGELIRPLLERGKNIF